MAKRLFDILFSAVVLLVLTPLLLAVAVWVRLDSPGPALFRQVRVGRGGREFRILKFRTMHVDAPARGPQITAGRDPRITRAGHVLRRYKIDEFPQFINVLVGDMSVVGPRPEVPRYVAMYPTATRELVLSVRPGITDLASIEYRDESELLGRSADPERTYVDQVMPAKLAYCERYVRERSFVGDIGIIGRSFAASFVSR
ncbi:sugar transferase [Piscinibacter sp.]|uniref:sugar transferase n=1 Tax=Piscinibacter sp. TaxID=1903157 RepID=UPI0039E2A86F